MLRRIDRQLLRVDNLPAAVRYYTQSLGLKLLRQDTRLAICKLPDSDAELVLHSDPTLPDNAVYHEVDDVRGAYAKREALRLHFLSPPVRVGRGWRADARDPFGVVLHLIDRTGDADAVEDAAAPGLLFADDSARVSPDTNRLSELYQKIGRTADDLPYTTQFEALHSQYALGFTDPKPGHAETWRHLLNLRKAGKLPRLGEARSPVPDVPEEVRVALLAELAEQRGRRDRLPYSPTFDRLAAAANKLMPRPLTPHQVWRLVATLSK